VIGELQAKSFTARSLKAWKKSGSVLRLEFVTVKFDRLFCVGWHTTFCKRVDERGFIASKLLGA
jgi:hypothetical protein